MKFRLDLNGYEITFGQNATPKSGYAIFNHGEFTILDSAKNGTIRSCGIANFGKICIIAIVIF